MASTVMFKGAQVLLERVMQWVVTCHQTREKLEKIGVRALACI